LVTLDAQLLKKSKRVCGPQRTGLNVEFRKASRCKNWPQVIKKAAQKRRDPCWIPMPACIKK
jgi:hypothetical protein